MKTKKAKDISAIPTFYGGVQFKSRMEAQCAVLFDKLGWKWEYENFSLMLPSGTSFIPDFWIKDRWLLVECRGYSSARGNRQIEELAEMLCVAGDTGLHPELDLPDGDGEFYYFLTIGPDAVTLHRRPFRDNPTSIRPVFANCSHGDWWLAQCECCQQAPCLHRPSFEGDRVFLLTVQEGRLFINGTPLDEASI